MNDLSLRYGAAEAAIREDLSQGGLVFEDEPDAAPPRLSVVTEDERTAPRDPAFDVLDAALPAHRDRLLAFASVLNSYTTAGRIVFNLEVGDLSMKYLWMSHDLATLLPGDIVILRALSADMTFSPRRGATLSVQQVVGSSMSSPLNVTCLTRVPEYAGIDMLVFQVVASAGMEKQGRITEASPSAVSGRPSTHVVAGVPLADGEPAQDAYDINTTEKSAAAALWDSARRAAGQFDKTRP